MAVFLEEIESVAEYGRATLNAIVQPGGAVLFLVQGYGSSLASTYRCSFDKSDFEFLWMLGKSGGA